MNSNRWRIAGLVLAGLAALLFWSELIFSVASSLIDVATPAEQLGWSLSSTRLYFIGLGLLDLIGGVFAIIYLIRSRRSAAGVNATSAALGLVITLLVYGVYQFSIAFALPQSLQGLYWGIGSAYVIMGLVLRFISSRQGKS